jgi:predicted phage terminase large subunit-like protein
MEDVFFALQYLNQVVPEGAQKFPKERLHFYSAHDIKYGKNYCFFDPSKGKKESDFPAVIWVNWYKNKARLFDAIDDRIEIADLIKIIADMNKKYYVVSMIAEDNGTLLLEDNLLKAHKTIGYPISLIMVHESMNKEARIRDMQPQLFSGFFSFHEDYEKKYPELMNQVIFYPAWGNDDFPDVIQKSIAHLAPLLSEGGNMFETEDKKAQEVYY